MTDSSAQDPPDAPPGAATVETRKSRAEEFRRFARFLAVGVLNTAFGYGVFATVLFATHSQTAAVILGNVIGATFNYFTIGRLVFARRGFKAIIPFLLGYAIITAINLALVAAITGAGFHALIAQAVSIPILVIVSYAWNRLVVFR